MNTANRLILWSGLIVLLFTAIVPAVAHELTEVGNNELTITGTVRDRETRKKLVNVTVALAGSSIATDYNIIEPTESLEKAVKKLRKSL